jgi:amino acid transporter
MKGGLELFFYVTVGIGMALSCSSFMMVGGLFEVTTLFWILISLAVAGVFCIVIALSIGELAGMYPSSPAIVTYFKTAFGNRVSLVFIYLYLIFLVLIAGVESYVFALVTKALVPGIPPIAVVLALLVAVVVMNLLALELPRSLQMALTSLAVAIIFVAGAIGAVRAPHLGAVLGVGRVGHGAALVPAAMGLAVFLFMGFEWVTPLGLRPSAYARKVPSSMPLAIVVLIATYAVFALGANATVPRHLLANENTPQVPYFRAAIGHGGQYLAGVLSLSAIFSTFNAGVMGASRLVAALSRQGSLPAWCGIIRVSNGAPAGGILLLGSLALGSALVVVGFHLQLVTAVIGAAIVCVVYAGYMGSVIRLKRLAPERKRPYRTPVPAAFQWLTIALLLIVSIATLFSLPHRELVAVGGFIASAAVALGLSRWSVRRSDRVPVGARRGLSPS